jgi:hypothetical protein
VNPFRNTEAMLPVAGSIVIDEQVVPLTGVRLENGLLHFVGYVEECAKEVELRSGMEFRIHGSDGSEIAVCRWNVRGCGPVRTKAGQSLTVIFPVHFEVLIGGGEL